MQRVDARAVSLEATHAVEVDDGLVLQPGYYTATEWRTGVETLSGGVSWTAPKYKIELSTIQLASMGATDTTNNSISTDIDVTKLVRSGELTVT